MANRDAPAAGRFGDIGICALPAIGEARDSTDIFGCSPARHDGHSANDLHLLCVFRARLLGDVGTDILVRLIPFILFCLGVQIIWTGASELLGTVTLQRATMAMPLVTTIVAASVRGCASVRRAAALQTGYCLLPTGHFIARDQTHRAPPHTPSALAKSP
jgi:hypothetical protein